MSNERLFEDHFLTDGLQGKRVVVGFSGGADSVSLLCRLLELQSELETTVEAVHLNHCLRGEESLRDEAFVRNFCREHDVLLQVKRLDIGAMAAEKSQSVETCGREERYRFFQEVAGETGLIATAHTLSDDMETVVFHMIRGTGLKGLCGIPAKRGNVVRPLLHCTRAEVEDYCRRKGLSFVTDSTNASTDYLRNKIRAEIIPRFFEINPSSDRSFARMKEILQRDEEHLTEEVDEIWSEMQQGEALLLDPVASQSEAMVFRIAIRVLEQYGFPLENGNVQRVARLLQGKTGRQEMTGGCYLKAQQGRLVLEKEPPEIPYFQQELFLPIESGCVTVSYAEISRQETVWRERKLYLQRVCGKDIGHYEKIYKNLLIFALDYDTIVDKLIFRQKKSGDWLKKPKSNGSKTLKKFFNEKKIPLAQRKQALILCDQTGVLAAEFLGVSQRAVVTEKTKQMLLITTEQLPAEK